MMKSSTAYTLAAALLVALPIVMTVCSGHAVFEPQAADAGAPDPRPHFEQDHGHGDADIELETLDCRDLHDGGEGYYIICAKGSSDCTCE